MKSLSTLIVVCIWFLSAVAQPDSLEKKPASTIIFSSESNLELTGTDIIDERIDALSKPELRMGGYMSWGNAVLNQQNEFIVCLDLWF